MPSTHFTLNPKPRSGGDLTPNERQIVIFELEIVRGELLGAVANIDRLIDQWTDRETRTATPPPDVPPQFRRRNQSS